MNESQLEQSHGFHDEQSDASGRWVRADSGVTFTAAPVARFLDFWVFSEFYDLSQTLTVATGGRVAQLALPRGWSPASVEVPAGAGAASLAVNKIIPALHHPLDPRELRRQASGPATARRSTSPRADFAPTSQHGGNDPFNVIGTEFA